MNENFWQYRSRFGVDMQKQPMHRNVILNVRRNQNAIEDRIIHLSCCNFFVFFFQPANANIQIYIRLPSLVYLFFLFVF